MKTPGKRRTQEIGWREIIALPELGILAMPAKIDTGARSSALHATHIREVMHEGKECVSFRARVPGFNQPQPLTMPLVDVRDVKNTGGIAQRRYVIKTRLVMADRSWPIEITLTNRKNMTFELILGRTAVRDQGLLVNSGRSYLLGAPLHTSAAV